MTTASFVGFFAFAKLLNHSTVNESLNLWLCMSSAIASIDPPLLAEIKASMKIVL